MNLIDRVGSDTIMRLERAASARLEEARWLIGEDYYLAGIYLCGYAAEMWIGSAYLKLIGFSPSEPIDEKRRWAIIKMASQRAVLSEPSHPLDGWARLLVVDKASLTPPGYDATFRTAIVARVNTIARHWSPRLRYRDLDATPRQAHETIDAATWLATNYARM